MVIVTLDAVAQSYDGSDMGVASIDTPVLVGGGSVSDGSDASYVEMGTWRDNVPVDHYEPLSCDFVLPSAYSNPTAIACKMRLRSDPDIAADPPISDPSGLLLRLHAVSDGTLLGSVSGGGAGAVYLDVITGANTSITERSFWFDDIDLGDPTDAGFWFEFAVDAGDPTACIDALTGSGLRVAIAIDPGDALSFPERRRPWLDIYEFQLLVACDSLGLFPLRRVPAVNNGGFGPTRHHPRTVSRRAGGSY